MNDICWRIKNLWLTSRIRERFVTNRRLYKVVVKQGRKKCVTYSSADDITDALMIASNVLPETWE